MAAHLTQRESLFERGKLTSMLVEDSFSSQNMDEKVHKHAAVIGTIDALRTSP